jgi:hypothetical protein
MAISIEKFEKIVNEKNATIARLRGLLEAAICHIERMNIDANDSVATPESELEAMKAELK